MVQNIAEWRRRSVVILTTHSMEEAEALCSRLAIQVDRRFRCLGSAQQLKTRYERGLELNRRFVTSEADMVLRLAWDPGHFAALSYTGRNPRHSGLSLFPLLFASWRPPSWWCHLGRFNS